MFRVGGGVDTDQRGGDIALIDVDQSRTSAQHLTPRLFGLLKHVLEPLGVALSHIPAEFGRGLLILSVLPMEGLGEQSLLGSAVRGSSV